MTILAYIFAALSALCCLWLAKLAVFGPRIKAKPMMTFEFPADLTSADVGLMIDSQVDYRDVLSLIPWFAAQGYLRMERVDDEEMKGRTDGVRTNFVLHRLQSPSSLANRYEHTFFEALFPDGATTRELVYAPDALFGMGWRETVSELSMRRSKMEEPILYATVLQGVAFVLMLAAMCCLGELWNMIGASLLIALFPLVAIMLTTIFRDSVKDANVSTKMKFMFVSFGGFGIFLIAMFAYADYMKPHALEIVGGLTVAQALLCAFSTRFVRPTKLRREQMSELLGLKEYIRCAESQELRQIVTDNPRVFYRILAFGMAFGLAPKWVQKFRSISVMVGHELDDSLL